MRFVEFRDVPVDSIEVGPRLRELDEDWVEVLAGLMATDGLQHPVGTYEVKNSKLKLMAGGHRLAARKRTKRKSIRVSVWEPETDNPELEAIIHEASENIGRRELSALDRAIHLGEMKAAHEQLYPESKRGGDRGNQHTGGKSRQTDILSFSQSAAEKSGLSSKSISRAVSIHERLDKAALALIRSLPIADNSAQLMALCDLPPHKQKAVAMALSGGLAKNVSEALGNDSKPSPDGFDGLVKAWGRAVPKEHRRFLKSIGANLEGGGA